MFSTSNPPLGAKAGDGAVIVDGHRIIYGPARRNSPDVVWSNPSLVFSCEGCVFHSDGDCLIDGGLSPDDFAYQFDEAVYVSLGAQGCVGRGYIFIEALAPGGDRFRPGKEIHDITKSLCR